MKTKKAVLVTGGAGFIGSHLCERLLKKGYYVICVDNFNDFYDPEIKEQNISDLLGCADFTLIRGDILDVDLLKKIHSGKHKKLKYDLSSPVTVIHLAAMAGVRPSLVSPTKYVDVDIKGTVNLLEMARQFEVEKFIFGSSSSVYGINQEVPFSEEQETDKQVSPYATAKKAAEQYCRTYNHLYEVPIAALRFFTVYGPRQRPEMAIHKFARLMSQGKPIPMYGDGTSERDYTYVDDVIDGIVAAVKADYDFEIINLGNSETVKLRELIELLGQKMGIEPKIDQQPEQPGDVPITYADISQAREVLGYEPKISIGEGLQRFVNWYRAHHRQEPS